MSAREVDAKARAVRLHQSGYRPISNKHHLCARIDREDWQVHMASKHVNGIEWVDALGEHASEYFRRCLSKDRINTDWRTYRELKRLGGRFTMEYQPVRLTPIRARRLAL